MGHARILQFLGIGASARLDLNAPSAFDDTALPSAGGTCHAQAPIAFHLLLIAQHVIAEWQGKGVSLALGMLDAELPNS
jgi:hypothetical protein